MNVTRWITGPDGVSGRRRAAALALGLLAGSLAAAGPAAAESVVSPTGMVAVSVPAPVVAGTGSTYTMTVTNTTADPLQNVIAAGSLSSGVSVTRIAGCARLGGNQSSSFLCSMPDLAPGASESAGFTLVAATAGTFALDFGASGRQPIPDEPGAFQVVADEATLSVSAAAAPTDIQVTGSSNSGSPNVGSSFTYTFLVKDDGPLPASGVTFDDALPAGVVLGGTVTTSTGSCTADTAANSVHCDIGALAVGQQATVSFPATATATGSFADTAAVALSGTDTHPANNSVTVTVRPR
ncbi:MAG TPA: DUF11 domain-containing protein [Actinocrinis sp.]|nr:DUF11 domain-containing protein [Actinocrinis sp.]